MRCQYTASRREARSGTQTGIQTKSQVTASVTTLTSISSYVATLAMYVVSSSLKHFFSELNTFLPRSRSSSPAKDTSAEEFPTRWREL